MLQSTLGTLSSRLPDYPVDIPHEIQNNFISYTRNMMSEQILWNTVEMIYIKISFFQVSPKICNGRGFLCYPFLFSRLRDGKDNQWIKITFCQKLCKTLCQRSQLFVIYLTPTYQLHKGHEEGFGNSITRGCHGNTDFVFFKVLLQIGLLKR